MTAGLLLVSPRANGVGDTSSLQVVQGKAFFRCNGAVCDRQGDEPLPSGVETGLAKRAAVTGHNDVTP